MRESRRYGRRLLSSNPLIRKVLANSGGVSAGLFCRSDNVCSLVAAQSEVITAVEIHGNRRIPADTIRARIFTRPGDVYDQAAMERDFNSLWNTGYFEDIRFEREQTPKGWIIHIYVKERPTIREINYTG